MHPPSDTSPERERPSVPSARNEARKFVAIMVFAVGALLAAVAWKFALPLMVMRVARWVMVLGSLAYAVFKRSLTTSILVSMVVGIVIGLEFPAQAIELRVLSKIFLKLVKTIIAPLLFATLVVGIAGHSDIKQVGRMGLKAIIYFEVVTTLALFVGLAAINITKAGVGVDPPAVMEETDIKGQSQTLAEVILHIFPENIALSVAEGQILQIVVFSILFGIALAMLPENHKKPLLHLCESLAEVMFKFTNIIMLYAPIGVGAAIAYTVGHMGIDILKHLLALLATLYVALAVFLLLVLVPAALLAGVPLRRFAAAIATPVSIAFATTSSEAALPRAMEAMEDMGCPREVVAFVMPTGYSFNLDGTTLYLSLASVFVAQAANIEMSMGDQLWMVFTLMITSKGVAGVPRASLVILLGTAASFGLPEWPILAILGIDELMDMARTSVNVIGNCLATLVIGRWEGVYHPDALPTIRVNPLDEADPSTEPEAITDV
jgi:proton glutamate symport protein